MTPAYAALLAEFLPGRRWFAGKGRSFTVQQVHALPWLPLGDGASGELHARVEIVSVEFENGDRHVYQLLAGYLPAADPALEHALIGPVSHDELGDVVAYDGVHVKEVAAALLSAFAAGSAGGMRFHCADGAELPDGLVGSVLSAEQSNTSIVYGDAAILKLFRRLSPGRNPDIEIHDALTRNESNRVAPLLGWVEGDWTDAGGAVYTGDLAMLQELLRTASDGWELALASVRDLLAEADLHPEEVGGDFAGESTRLGEAVAEVHEALATAFGAAESSDGQPAEIAAAMSARLDAAVDEIPELADHRDGLAAIFDRLAAVNGPIRVQRVHGDLHLGQTLRTVKGWKVIDFEGEPARPMAERTRLSSPLQDVAGMLRSFDYTASATLEGFGDNAQLSYRADEWSARNRAAFLSGYSSVAGGLGYAGPELLSAYEADKAVYEVGYEARHRPTWISVALRGVARIAGGA